MTNLTQERCVAGDYAYPGIAAQLIMNADGTHLISGDYHDIAPRTLRWSPDGSMMIYISQPDSTDDAGAYGYVTTSPMEVALAKEDGEMNQHTIQTKAEMLIRKPVAEVFEAFINPEITSKFWFTRGSGRLEAGKQVQWDWEMYDISIPVTVQAIEPNKRIVIEWPGYGSPTTVEWVFAPQKDGTTFVSITESGFTGGDDELLKQVAASTQGFTLVLAGLKALLEHNVRLNLVADRFPKGLTER